MFSYVFMKILESSPAWYDSIINLVSSGHSSRVINKIVSDVIEPSMEVLDLGCGTGTLAVSAAGNGARVTGIDASPDMIAVARKKIKDESLEGEITLENIGVTELDQIDDNSFDCIVSTLVFSELTSDEREYTLTECYRILKDDGLLAIADETVPDDPFKRELYRLMRLPLALLTFVLSGKGTSAVPDLESSIEEAGFETTEFEKNDLGSFTLLVARKGEAPPAEKAPRAKTTPAFKRMVAPVFEYLLRWFPYPMEPGLRAYGNPDRDSPVLVTANYSLTQKRLEKGLQGLDCYILATPTKGINVWCSSSDGNFNAREVASTVKASRIEELVDHRRLVLPQLCAPGVKKKEVSELTDWKARFGPVYSEDIPAYVGRGFEKTPEMHIYDFRLKNRLDLAISMNAQYFLLAVAFLAKYRPKLLPGFATRFWTQTLITYLCFDRIPGKYGITRSVVAGTFFGSFLSAYHRFIRGKREKPWIPILTSAGLGMFLGIDLAGITGILKDEPIMIANKLGIRKIGPFTMHELGQVYLDEEQCIGCGSCYDVCPRGVFSIDKTRKKSEMKNPDVCEICKACLMQCPAEALALHESGKELRLSQARLKSG